MLSLRGGTYLGGCILTEKIGTPDNPIVIRSFPGEHAVLDGATLEEFAVAPNDSWEPLGDGEFRSRATFERTDDDRARGSFLGPGPYTRLISYSRLQDLRADNQLFGELPPGSTLPGFEPLRRQQAATVGLHGTGPVPRRTREDPTSSTKTPVWATSTSG